MTFVGFQFTKIAAERFKPAQGQININRRCQPINVEKLVVGNQTALKYDFEYEASYNPKVGSIVLAGNITEIIDEDSAKEILDYWEKSKVLPPKVLERVLNAILAKTQVQALVLSKELNIPPPMHLPRVKVKTSEEVKSED